jgi:type III pantothenate kinase
MFAGRATDARIGGVLTVDLGNSRAKVRLWALGPRAPDCRERADFEGTDLERELGSWLAARRVEQAVLSSVAGSERTERVRALLRAQSGELIDAPPPGLRNLCRSPERVGRDRLYAARGALAELARSCLVVDAGTALTVDALRVEAGEGSFLGGAIAPGPALLARALADGTARLPRVEPAAGARALGRDTEEALASGIAVGFRGAARELVERIAAEAALGAAPVCLTGGARAFLLEPEPFTERVLDEQPDLVHRGLIEAALDLLRDRR